MSFLKILVSPEVLPTIQATQALANPYCHYCPQLSKIVGTDVIFYPLLGHVMTDNEHEILIKFLKLKPMCFRE